MQSSVTFKHTLEPVIARFCSRVPALPGVTLVYQQNVLKAVLQFRKSQCPNTKR